MFFFISFKFFGLKSVLSHVSIAILLLHEFSFPSFHFQPDYVFGSKVSLLNSIWLDHVFLSILPICLLTGEFNLFTFKVTTDKEGFT